MERIFKPKFFSIVKEGYSGKQFSSDVMAGIVVGVVALPLAVAFAVASGVSPEKGLVTAVIAGFIISMLGGSRVQIGGPTGAFIVIVYSILSQYGFDGLLISTILAGIFLVVFGLLKLGSLLKYFPHPLIVGFTSGIALVIFSTQIRDAFGLDIQSVPSTFVEKWKVYFLHLHSINIYAVSITAATILMVVFSKNYIRKIPGSLLAIIIGTAMVQVFKLPVTTIESFFGEIPNSIHFQFPKVDFSNLGYYFQPALTIALLGAIESLLSAVVSDGMIGGHHRSNTELIGQGIANIVAPFFGAIPATGAIARTATNVKNGGRTPVAGMIHAVVLLLIMLFFGKWVKLIPMSCLAGILIVVAYNMSEWRTFRSILKGSVFDILILLSTFFLTVLVDLTVAIEVGVVLSALLFMKRMADLSKTIPAVVDSDVIEDYSALPREIGIYEISGPLFFASAKQYCEVLKSTGLKSKIIIIRMRHVPFVDSTGLQNLTQTLKILKDSGIKVILSGVNVQVKQALAKSNIFKLIDEEFVLESFDKALQKAQKMID
ncbi:SulP family inorganic anion transporter [Maribellus maritimus]|uniref:SulP family inorganic anion transporter n=1 Tax=Maribellus maritimus TaxID=2870838 RepID=UPI001EEBDFFE|nr:SulP family inorganic anion transporter [Maribellus maritimus]MCG6187065.1 STAS domain-containing protein [Maribellus maritimus]